MKEKFNSYMPLWFLLMVPPMVLIFFGWNFILSGLGLMIGLLVVNIPEGFTKYSKKIFKLWGLSILIDVITFVLLVIPEFFSENEFISKNLVYPIEHNPYSKIISLIYMIMIFIFIVFITYSLINKFIIKGIESKKNKIKIMNLIIMLFILPYLLFIPSSLFIKEEKNNIEDFKGTITGDKSDVVTIMKYLGVSKYINSYVLDTHREPYTINLYLKEIDADYIKTFEMDASTIFALISDVNEVNFYMNDIIYEYDINKINKIYGDIKKDGMDEITSRYTNKLFDKYIYLDHISSYDLFDESEVCEEGNQELFTYNDDTYYLECTTLDNIVLYNNFEKVMTLKEAINSKKITEEEIINSFLKIKTDKDINNENNS